MVNFQKIDFLRFLTINSVTTDPRKLNGTSLVTLATHIQSAKARDIDEVSSGLAKLQQNLHLGTATRDLNKFTGQSFSLDSAIA